MSLEASKEPSQLKCTALLQIRPEPRTFKIAIQYLFTSEPSLEFQITQVPSWKEDCTFPEYNIWSPAYFGTTLSQHGEPYKLNRNDLIVTRYDQDTSLKNKNTETISFDIENMIGSIDIDYPPFLSCTCCLQHRGRVRLGNEGWKFKEIMGEYFQFEREQEQERSGDVAIPESNRSIISWYPSTGHFWENKEPRLDLPFTMDKDTRICRLNRPDMSISQTANKKLRPDATIAVMNRDGFVFLDYLPVEQGGGFETCDLRGLVVLTGLAVAKLERPGLK